MKEQNIIRMKCITILLPIILLVISIVAGFSQEYRSSSLSSGGVGGLIIFLHMLKAIWSVKASQRKREQLTIDEAGECNLLIQKNSRAQAFNISLTTTLAASVLASLYHEEATNSCFNILLGIQLFAYLLIWTYYERRLQPSISQTCRMKPITGMHAQSSKVCRVRPGSCRVTLKMLPVHKFIGYLYIGSFARLRDVLYSPEKMVL